MSERMYVCFKCENKVRTLYEWKGEELFCGMCQQENIEKYEATIVYRFFLLLQLTKDFTVNVRDQVFFPPLGWFRMFIRFAPRKIEEGTAHARRIQTRMQVRRERWKKRRAERRSLRAESKTIRKRQKMYLRARRKEASAIARAKVLKAAG